MNVQSKESAVMLEYKKRVLKLFVYVGHSEADLEMDRRSLMKKFDSSVISMANFVFGKKEKLPLMIFKNKVEVHLGVDFDLANLKLALMRVHFEVDRFYPRPTVFTELLF